MDTYFTKTSYERFSLTRKSLLDSLKQSLGEKIHFGKSNENVSKRLLDNESSHELVSFKAYFVVIIEF